jgi:hypothetical protein
MERMPAIITTVTPSGWQIPAALETAAIGPLADV